jgi:single-strand DNA-binding protein
MLNSVILIGRITNDLEIKKSAKGVEYLFFNLAINRRMNKEQTDFIPCTAFGKTAQVIAQYLKKGSLINIEGSIQSSTFQKDGKNQTRYNVIVKQINFIESRNASSAAKPAAGKTVNVDKINAAPVSATNNKETEESELRALFDDMDFFNE